MTDLGLFAIAISLYFGMTAVADEIRSLCGVLHHINLTMIYRDARGEPSKTGERDG